MTFLEVLGRAIKGEFMFSSQIKHCVLFKMLDGQTRRPFHVAACQQWIDKNMSKKGPSHFQGHKMASEGRRVEFGCS